MLFKKTYYVYVLRSEVEPSKTYVGFTERPSERLLEHNNGSQVYTRRYKPWRPIAYFGFPDRSTASKFEKYLKTPSGKAFLNKHIQISPIEAT